MQNAGSYRGAAGDGRRPDDSRPTTTTSATNATTASARPPPRPPTPPACDLLAELLAEPSAIERSRMKFAARNNSGGCGGAGAAVAPSASSSAAPGTAARYAAPPLLGALSAPVSAPFAAPPPFQQQQQEKQQQQHGRRLPPSLALAAAAKAEAARQAAAESPATPAAADAADDDSVPAPLLEALAALEASAAESLLEGTEPPPGTLSVELHPYQKVALAWMLARESGEGGGGGILADEQGLGKTVEAAALIGTAPRGGAPAADDDDDDEEVSASFPRGGTLVVCPNSLLHQWLAELRTKIDHRAFQRARSPSVDGNGDNGGNDGEGGGDEEVGGVVKYHGADRRGDPRGLARADVVVTIYDTVRVDWRPQGSGAAAGKKRARSGGSEDGGEEVEEVAFDEDGRGNGKALPKNFGPIHSVRWSRIICDEAQLIRNASTGNAKAAHALRSASRGGRGRWCLTGTPVVNGVDDLFSLFAFLRHEPWCRADFFKTEISKPMAAANSRAEAAKKLRLALQAVTLRRTKLGLGLISETPLEVSPRGAASAATGASMPPPLPRAPRSHHQQQQGRQEPQTAKLPPRMTIIQKVHLSKPERKLYEKLARGASSFFSSPSSSSSFASASAGAAAPRYSYVNMMERLLRLRQACDHPALVPEWRRLNSSSSSSSSGFGGAFSGADASAAAALELRAATTAEEKAAASRLAPRVRHALLATLQAQGQLCGRCMDVPEHPACVTPCRHLYCRGCALLAFPRSSSSLSSPSAAADASAAGPRPSASSSASAATAPCASSRPCLVCRVPVPPRGAMTKAALLGGDAKDDDEEQEQGQQQQAKGNAGGSGSGNDKDEEEEQDVEEGSQPLSSQPLSSFGSAKLDALMAIVLAVAERNRRAKREARAVAAASGGGGSSSGRAPEKVVVFSQWTSMLDLVCDAFNREKVRFSRIDGGMNPAQREAAVAAFQALGDGEGDDNDDDNGCIDHTTAAVPVIVVSLKAASLGLNLTAASTVVLLDPWFNRATEQQAADRAHRLGQRAAEVRVVRLIAEGTVEEWVVQLAEDKMRVAAAALGGEKGMTTKAMMGAWVSGEELRFLITGLK